MYTQRLEFRAKKGDGSEPASLVMEAQSKDGHEYMTWPVTPPSTSEKSNSLFHFSVPH